MANRLSKVLDPVISEGQSAFIGGRQLSDDIVILNEVIEEVKREKKCSVIFKIDFAKAYDSVKWNFLDSMMKKINFSIKWGKWILECVSSASASVLVNGSPSGNFNLGRGLRQGDPLSPFLFLIVAKGLSLLVSKAVEIKLLEAVEIGKEKVRVSHLQYADDTRFLCPGKLEYISVIKAILRNFELLSGLSVNFDKSVFGASTWIRIYLILWQIFLGVGLGRDFCLILALMLVLITK